MDDTAFYISFLKHRLTLPRFEHSLGVMTVMGELADIYDLNRPQAMTAGLLHDAAKDTPPEQLLALAAAADLSLHEPWEHHPIYLHATVGAFVTETELGVSDRVILEAIFSHSFSPTANFDTPFSWCVRLADLLAPARAWPGMQKLKSIVYAGYLDEAALLQCGWLLEYFHEINLPIHPNLTASFQTLSAKLKVNGTFFERW
jgi:predicted HD superfamily hydrolase involved in NAD metabolism